MMLIIDDIRDPRGEWNWTWLGCNRNLNSDRIEAYPYGRETIVLGSITLNLLTSFLFQVYNLDRG
jgi:hypothetical protein